MKKPVVSHECTNLLRKVALEYPNAKKEKWPNHPINKVVTEELPSCLRSTIDQERYIVKGHDGVGRWAKVPWIGIHRKEFGSGGQAGIYIAILFSADGQNVYFSLQQGTENLKKAQLAERSKRLRREFKLPEQDEMQLASSAARPRSYQMADLYHSTIDSSAIAPESVAAALMEVIPTLDSITDFFGDLKSYQHWVAKESGEANIAVPKPISFSPLLRLVTTFYEAISSTRIICSPRISVGLVTTTVTKPFTILTGNSGTGKTKLAQLFAQWLDGGVQNPDDPNIGKRYALVPVGADWTDNRNVLGFANHLKLNEETKQPTFQSTPILDMVLRATKDSAHPYFIILDEMNLSHVERYFSDFLSAMESGEPVPVHSENGKLSTSSGQTVPAKITIPPNLFVIGTVNVDETTYMFSPKVLDRANVLEFRVEHDDLEKYLSKHVKGDTLLKKGSPPDPLPKTLDISSAPAGTAEAFLELSKSARGLDGSAPLENPPDLDKMQTTLLEFFQVLQKTGFEFAYRTANEVIRYARVSYALKPENENWNWKEVMDAQILQKLQPKLHGSRRRIEPTLVALAKLCAGEGVNVAMSAFDDNGSTVADFRESSGNWESKDFPMSWRKLAEMIETVRRDQFVSFIQ